MGLMLSRGWLYGCISSINNVELEDSQVLDPNVDLKFGINVSRCVLNHQQLQLVPRRSIRTSYRI
jgi:hypothetical protein